MSTAAASPVMSSTGAAVTPPQQDKVVDKLSGFLKDCLMMGCLRGFVYFELYSRGREELLITIKSGKEPNFDAPLHQPFTSTYGKLSTMSEGVPPASPSAKDAEMMAQDAVFLIGGYARYKCPFVWVRSNHTRLLDMKTTSGKPNNKDTPLDLQTTSKWKTENIKLWNIIEELIHCTLQPAPRNPFKIDFAKIESMPLLDRTLNSIALVNFLKKVYLKNSPYSDEGYTDTAGYTLFEYPFCNSGFIRFSKESYVMRFAKITSSFFCGFVVCEDLGFPWFCFICPNRDSSFVSLARWYCFCLEKLSSTVFASTIVRGRSVFGLIS